MRLLRIIKLMTIICCTFYLVGCTNMVKYKDGVVYSEKSLSNYSEVNSKEELDQFVSRDEAIEYSVSVFQDGFNKKILRDELSEYVTIVKLYGEFYWNINWQQVKNNEFTTQYYILVNSNTKEVGNCGVISASEYYEKNNEDYFEINKDDVDAIFNIVSPLVIKLEIIYTDYVIKPSSKNSNVSLILIGESESYDIEINLHTKEIVSFSILRGATDDKYFDSGR